MASVLAVLPSAPVPRLGVRAGWAVVVVACSTMVSSPLPAAEPQTLVLVGIDGFRPDYLDRADAPVLRALAARGVRAQGLSPPFPSKTFPSFTTIATGLLPARHGIVNNTMYDLAIPGRFALSDHVGRSDPRWWRGEPIWNTAERQGVRTAGLFWPGDDVEILGRRPSDYLPYDDDFPNDRRVELVLEWLSRPAATRPRLVLMYFSTVDVASHSHGPLSREALAAAATIDTLLGRLTDGIATRGLAASTNMVVVSDHGMAETHPDRVVILDDLLDLSDVDVIETGPSVLLRPNGSAASSPAALARWARATFAAVTGKHPRLRIYEGLALPARFRAGRSARLAPLIGLADEGWVVQTRAQRDRWIANGGGTRGEHGFDPALPSMHGLFVAAGPSFRAGHRVPPFESVHLYELLCRVLGIRPARNDGDPRVLVGAFASPDR